MMRTANRSSRSSSASRLAPCPRGAPPAPLDDVWTLPGRSPRLRVQPLSRRDRTIWTIWTMSMQGRWQFRARCSQAQPAAAGEALAARCRRPARPARRAALSQAFRSYRRQLGRRVQCPGLHLDSVRLFLWRLWAWRRWGVWLLPGMPWNSRGLCAPTPADRPSRRWIGRHHPLTAHRCRMPAMQPILPRPLQAEQPYRPTAAGCLLQSRPQSSDRPRLVPLAPCRTSQPLCGPFADGQAVEGAADWANLLPRASGSTLRRCDKVRKSIDDMAPFTLLPVWLWRCISIA